MLDEKVKCLVVDDEPLARGLLEKHIQSFSQLQLAGSCWNAIEAFEFLKKESIDLIFLDIQMPGISGISFLKSLQHPPAVIFTTAYRGYAVESYELNVVDYLLKPITMDRFLKSVNKYMNAIRPQPPKRESTLPSAMPSEQFIYVNANRKHIKIQFEEVEFIESLKDYVCIHCGNEKTITKDKISGFEKKLPDYFLRVHRSYIVNTKKITAYTSQDIEIEKKEIPIGISYKQSVMTFLQQT